MKWEDLFCGDNVARMTPNYNRRVPAKPTVLWVLVMIVFVTSVTVLARNYRAMSSTFVATDESSILTSCSENAILCGVDNSSLRFHQLVDLLHLDTLKLEFHRLMTSLDNSPCGNNFTRFGRSGDGGYDICMATPFKPQSGNCLVYSFGVSGDWSFDEAMAKYGCEVHSFDPRWFTIFMDHKRYSIPATRNNIGKEDHLHSAGVHFHNLGLWGSDVTDERKWKLRKISSIRRELGHDNRVLDVLKVDVEAAEWPFVRNLVDVEPAQTDYIRQLLLEYHTPRGKQQQLSKTDLVEMIYYAKRLSERGLTVVRNRQVNWCCGNFANMMPASVVEKCCHETFYVNKRFLQTS